MALYLVSINNVRKPCTATVFGRFLFLWRTTFILFYAIKLLSYNKFCKYFGNLTLLVWVSIVISVKCGFYTTLLTKCELNRHLADVNKQAEDMFFRLVKQMADREGVTEELKANNQMEWVARINLFSLSPFYY